MSSDSKDEPMIINGVNNPVADKKESEGLELAPVVPKGKTSVGEGAQEEKGAGNVAPPAPSMGVVEETLGTLFEGCARKVYKCPVKVIIASFIIPLILMSGVVKLTQETRKGVLFVDLEGSAQSDVDFARRFFPELGKVKSVYDVQIASTTRDLSRDSKALKALEWFKNQTHDERGYTLECLVPMPEGKRCPQYSLLGRNAGLEADKAVLKVNEHLCYPVFKNEYMGGDFIPSLSYVSAPKITNTSAVCPGGGKTVLGKADALKASYFKTYDEMDEEPFLKELKWLVETALPALQAQLGSEYTVTVKNEASLGDELGKSTGNDIPLFAASISLMACFAIASFYSKDMALVALTDVMGGFLAILCAFGVGAMGGVKFSSVVAFFPFILLGTSVDDTFIMLQALHNQPKTMAPEDRIAAMLKRSGPSMLMTTLTDTLAFMIGALSTSYLGVSTFCWYSMIGTVFDFILQCTWCTAWASLNTQRQSQGIKGQCNTCCCRRIQRGRDISLALPLGDDNDGDGDGDGYGTDMHAASTSVVCVGRCGYETLLRKTWFRVLMLLTYAALLGGAIYGIVEFHETNVGQELAQLAPKNSYLIDYIEMNEEHFTPEGLPVQLLFTTGPDAKRWKYWETNDLSKINKCVDKFRSKPFMKADYKAKSWYVEFHKNSSLPSTKEAYMKDLMKFIVKRPDLKDTIKLVSDNSAVDATLIEVWAKPKLSPKDGVDVFRSLQLAQDECEEMGITVGVLIGQDAAIFFEADAAIISEVLLSLGLGVAGVGLVVLCFIPKLFVAAVTTIAIASIDVMVVGFMFIGGQSINTVTMISLLMSVGFSADFVAHVSLAFTLIPNEQCKGSNVERIALAMREVAAPVTQAGVSTLLAIVTTAFSDSQIFFSFFIITFLVLLFGLMHGLLFLPSLFSFTGPIGSK